MQAQREPVPGFPGFFRHGCAAQPCEAGVLSVTCVSVDHTDGSSAETLLPKAQSSRRGVNRREHAWWLVSDQPPPFPLLSFSSWFVCGPCC